MKNQIIGWTIVLGILILCITIGYSIGVTVTNINNHPPVVFAASDNRSPSVEQNRVTHEVALTSRGSVDHERDTYKEYAVPNIDSSFKTYMDYRTITYKDSLQYKLQQKAYTNEEGFRMIDGKYMIALGTYYTKECGVEFEVELSSGIKINCIVGDIKRDADTNSTHQFIPQNGNVVEFIVCTRTLRTTNSYILKTGDVSSANLKGKIVSIRKKLKNI